MPDEPIPFDPALAAPLLGKGSHNGWLGLRYRDHGEDWVELELPWRADLLGEEEEEVLASGPIISLMDMASGLSIWTRKKLFQPIATLDLRVDYLRGSRPGERVRTSAVLSPWHSAAFVRGIAHDGDADDPVAHIAGRVHDYRHRPEELCTWLKSTRRADNCRLMPIRLASRSTGWKAACRYWSVDFSNAVEGRPGAFARRRDQRVAGNRRLCGLTQRA